MLGGTPVLIDPGVPLVGSEVIGCSFGGIETDGVHISSNLALCVSPTLQNVGFLPFELSITDRPSQETEFLSGIHSQLQQCLVTLFSLLL